MDNKNTNVVTNLIKPANSSGSTKLSAKSRILILVSLAALVLLPWLFKSNYLKGVLVSCVFTAFLAQTWNIMSGYAGLFSFGHACFFGLGAYTSSILYVDYGVTPWIGMFAGAVVAGLVGLGIAVLTCRFKLKGDYFALSTLAFAEIFRTVFNNVEWLHAAVGVTINYVNDWKVFQFASKIPYYYIALVMMILITLLIWRIRHTKIGLYFIAIREDENAADALGVNVYQYKLIAISMSAALCAMIGTFYAQYYAHIEPTTVFISTISVDAILPCIIGGVGTVLGPIIGAFILIPVQELANMLFSGVAGANMVAYGVVMIAVVMLMPNGVLGFIQDRKNTSNKKRMRKEDKVVK